MYESPINLIVQNAYSRLVRQKEDCVYTEIQNMCINVDKEELLKALQYDRSQYEKGYRDGQRDGQQWIPCSERLPEKSDICEYQGFIVQQKNICDPFVLYWNGEKWVNEYCEEEHNILAWQPLPEPYREE